ncbi:MAG: MFS transporter, partial [Chloroflexi bacterium]|nr:MFS transporter [Chloroflexota bacterium]
TLPWLVTSRVVQAVGGGATIPIAMALAGKVLPRPAVALGVVGAAAEAGAVFGPLYGGAIIRLLDWRWVFWLNLPLCAILVVGLALLPQERRAGGRVDYLGGLLLASGLTVISVALSHRAIFALTARLPYLLLSTGVLFFGLLALHLRRSRFPLLQPFLFRSTTLLSAVSTQFLIGVALIFAMVTVPLITDTVMGRPPLEGGLRLMRLTGAIPLGAVLGGYLASLVSNRVVTWMGLGLIALGLFWMSGWQTDLHEPRLSLHLATAGLGFGLVIAPIMASALGNIPDTHHATVASLVTVARMVGMTLGLAALSAWGMDHFQGLAAQLFFPFQEAGETAEEFQRRVLDYEAGVAQASLSTFKAFFLGGAVIALAALLPALGMGSSGGGKRQKAVPP